MLGALTSLTGGGGLSGSGGAATSTSGDTGNVGVNVGGLNVPALPGQQNLMLIAGIAIVGLILWKKL